MKKSVLLFVIALTSFPNIYSQEWLSSFEDAKRIALQENKPIFAIISNQSQSGYYFPSRLPGGIRKKVIKIINENFIPVKLDWEVDWQVHRELKTKGSIGNTNVTIRDANGYLLHIVKTYNIHGIIDELRRWSLNTSSLKESYDGYTKNSDVAYELAMNYLDLSLLLKSTKKFDDVFYTANLYFDYYIKKSRKYTDENDLHLKREFFKIKKYLILNKPKRAIKRLNKYNFDELMLTDKSTFASFYYLAYSLLEDPIKAENWKLKSSSIDLSKAEKIIDNYSN